MAELSWQDMKFPRVGQIRADSVWPDTSAKWQQDTLTELLRQGYVKADAIPVGAERRNDAAMYWTRYLAYDSACVDQENLPSAADARDEGSNSWGAFQLTALLARRDQALADFQAVVDDDAAVPEVASTPRTSRSVRFEVEIV